MKEQNIIVSEAFASFQCVKCGTDIGSEESLIRLGKELFGEVGMSVEMTNVMKSVL
jgi:hypothetical protein